MSDKFRAHTKITAESTSDKFTIEEDRLEFEKNMHENRRKKKIWSVKAEKTRRPLIRTSKRGAIDTKTKQNDHGPLKTANGKR